MPARVASSPALPPRRAPPSTASAGAALPASTQPRRHASRPATVEEDVRRFEDLPLPSFSVSPQRAVSPGKRNGRTGATLELSGAVFTDASLQVVSGAAAVNGVSASSPSSGSAGSAALLLQVPPPSSFEDPHAWQREYTLLRAKLQRPADTVTTYHDYAAPLNSRATMRHACVVRPLPSLEKVQEALRRRFRAPAPATAYDVCEQRCAADAGDSAEWCDDTVSAAAPEPTDGARGAHREQRNDIFVPSATTWCVGGSSYDNEVMVTNTVTGQRLLRILDPKMKVAVTALQHAPFRGFMEAQQLHVLPVQAPNDVLRLKAAQLVVTDYVWCGLQDGTVRLLPANHHHVRSYGPSPSFSKAPSVELVYELPRYQGGAVVSIVCSPCHDSAGNLPECALPNRVSEAVRCMTAAAAAASDPTTGRGVAVAQCGGRGPGDGATRQHLSLVCTAATDASVVVWDVRHVYEAVARAQQQQQQQQEQRQATKEATHGRGVSVFSHGGASAAAGSATAVAATAAGASNDVITFDCTSPVPGLQNMQVRSSCTVVQVKPVAKLSGGFAGLTALRWVSSLISAGSNAAAAAATPSAKERDARLATRDVPTAPRAVEGTPSIELAQTRTRFDKREEQRAELELTEEEMQGAERELLHMMPPLTDEPPQSLRVNLLVAADCMGTLHVWNLDEELHRCAEATESPFGWPASFGASFYSSLQSTSSRSDGCASGFHGSDVSATPPRSARRGAAGAAKAHGSSRKLDREGRGRRGCRGLGLAEARESRGRLSELQPNTAAAPQQKGDGEATATRKSLHRRSMGRGSAEERDTGRASLGGLQLTGAEREAGGRLSGGHAAVPVLSSPRKSHAAVSASSAAQSTLRGAPLAHSTSPAKGAASAADASPSTKTRKVKKTRASLQESSASALRSPQQSTSPARDAGVRLSVSHGRLSESQHASVRSRTSVQRGTSIAPVSSGRGASTLPDVSMPVQAAKCQIRVAPGTGAAAAGITDVVVDLPPHICTTLRRVPSPSHRVASWQHRPTEEEVELRVLENQFEELTEEKALFFAFQRLEMYVGVEGAMSLVRFAPRWLLPDDDDRQLFRTRGDATAALADVNAATTTTGLSWMAEVPMPSCVGFGAFELQVRTRLLDVHPQPITRLFLDSWQACLWVAREDGFAAVFGTHDKCVVARMPHPSADALLAAPSALEWARLQEQGLPRARVDDARAASGLGLECHKECRGLPPNHVTQFLAVSSRPQRSLLLLCGGGARGAAPPASTAAPLSQTLQQRSCQCTLSLTAPSATGETAAGGPLVSQMSLSSTRTSDTGAGHCGSHVQLPSQLAHDGAALVCLDGRTDLRNPGRGHETQLWRWLRQLQLCQAQSAAVCQAQRRRYYALCEGIGRNAAHVIGELGDYASLCQVREYFQLWRNHCAVYHHRHLMRRQRAARLERDRVLAARLEAARAAQLRGGYYLRWQRLVAERRAQRQAAALARFASAAVASPSRQHRLRRGGQAGGCLPYPTAAQMHRLHWLFAARQCWRAWQAWVASCGPHRQAQRRLRAGLDTAQLYRPLLSRVRSPAPSLASMATPPRRVRSGHRGGTDDFATDGVGTPFRPLLSDGVYSCTASTSSPLGSACKNGTAADDSAALATPPPPSLELLLAELLRARVYIFHFSDARSSATSVLDESWTVILENAESGAEGDDDDSRRFSVFRFALLPLLQGLVSTADDVLPNLFNESVAEEVLSMLVGIVLAIDYVTANAESAWPAPTSATARAGHTVAGAGLPQSAFDTSLLVLQSYAARAFASDPESAEVLRGLVKGRKVLAKFLDFAMERAVARRLAGI
ncbi:hypothetical protein NESM_000034800 [Novymonas esmeraldas]|uniref:Uncharacterized protein n=1 Tax=Novymonas esmeraldas TaxID=1808958 RepID=A0AAW0F1A7_9TRYP